MPTFEGAVDKRDTVVMEVSLVALNRRIAKARGTTWLLTRNVNEISAVNDIRTKSVSGGRVNEYRVLVELDKDKDLKSILGVSKAIDALEGRL